MLPGSFLTALLWWCPRLFLSVPAAFQDLLSEQGVRKVPSREYVWLQTVCAAADCSYQPGLLPITFLMAFWCFCFMVSHVLPVSHSRVQRPAE